MDASNPHPVYQMLEDFKNHPAVAPIIRGAKVVEHSGHMVPEGGYNMIPKYVFDGCLVAGETAGLCMNMGYQVRGMDFAVASGRMAGEAAVEAIDKGDVSEAGLSSYRTKMEGSFVIQDLKTFSKWPHVMEGWDRMFTEYPVMVKRRLQHHVQRGRKTPEAADEAHDAHREAARAVQARQGSERRGEGPMSGICDITVNVDEFLAIDKYEVDEESAHIELADDPDIEEFKKLVRVCPAALYKIDENGATSPSTTPAAWSAAPAA